MQLLIYASAFNPTGRKVLSTIGAGSPGMEIPYLHTVEDLEAHLKQPSHRLRFALLIPQSVDDLEDLIALSHLMRDARVVLILPADTPPINAKAHRLRPRFVGYPDVDPYHVAAIIRKLMVTEPPLRIRAVQ